MSTLEASTGQLSGRARGSGHAHAAGLSEGPVSAPSTRVAVAYGFWIFLISDIILFAAFFAAYAVLSGRTAGGPAGRELFDIDTAAIETVCLLASTLLCSFASVAANVRSTRWFSAAMAITFALGAAFVAIELREFAHLVQERGAGPQRSAFLSAFFALIGCHGLHVSAGLLWLLTMVAQVYAKGFRADILRRILCFALFWHTLDIIWVALFSLVYLVGVAR